MSRATEHCHWKAARECRKLITAVQCMEKHFAFDSEADQHINGERSSLCEQGIRKGVEEAKTTQDKQDSAMETDHDVVENQNAMQSEEEAVGYSRASNDEHEESQAQVIGDPTEDNEEAQEAIHDFEPQEEPLEKDQEEDGKICAKSFINMVFKTSNIGFRGKNNHSYQLTVS